LALCALHFPAVAEAQWKIVSSTEIGVAPGGVAHVRTTAEEQTRGETAELHYALWNPKAATLRVIDQPGEPTRQLGDVMVREKCAAGVNGGYFDPNFAPVGLLITEGRTVAPFRKAKLLTGVLTVAGANIELLRSAEFSPRRKLSAALQCGPFLVDHTRPVAGLNDTRAARRTFVATAGDRCALGICSDVTLAQLAAILSINGVAPDMKVTRAMNLDGGSSTAFWFRGAGEPFSMPEQKTVRNFVAVCPR
jgi:uncharacterized protein YigE (DUF2233 family)